MKNYPLYEVDEITSLKDMLENSVKKFGDKTAFLKKDDKKGPYQSVTFNEFYKDVEGLGTAFLRMEMSGKKIAVIGPNRYEWAVTYLSVVNGESMIVPIDKELPYEDWSNLLKIAEVSCVVYSSKYSEDMIRAREENPNLRYLVNMDLEDNTDLEISFKKLLASGKMMVNEGDLSFKNVKINPEEAQIILFTSGTTAMSKGVLLSHKNIATSLMSMSSMTYIGPDDVFLSILPLHHTYECTCGFLCPLYRGSTIAYCDGLKYILKNIEESKTTLMLCVPAVLDAMYKRIWSAAKKNKIDGTLRKGLKISKALMKAKIDIRKKIFKKIHDTFGGHFRMFVVGAAAVNPEVAQGLYDFGFLVIQGYGITECSPIVTLNRDVNFRHDSAGQAVPVNEVKIVDKNADGIGEIVCRGSNVMIGYYKNQEETDKVIVDGWFHTGDLGYMDDEGFCHITGRKKSVIVTSNGKNIFPEELEIFLNENEYILESMVYGEENEQDGETYLCALIVPKYDEIKKTFGEDVSDDKVKELIEEAVKSVNKRNPLYKYIRKYEIRENELIKTTTGKIKRYLEIPKK
ncbi:MAG: long-chain fatty acid--CoA ligase [Ruminococcaceae bacterium]|nr:long-chain fatty acid--CoA ligase [Oscillospiraceae bacterium]